MQWIKYIPYNDAEFKELYPQFAAISEKILKTAYNYQVLVSMTSAVSCAFRLSASEGTDEQKEACYYVAYLLLAGVQTQKARPLVVGTPSFTAGKDVKTAIAVAKKLGITGIWNFNTYFIDAFQYIAEALKLNPVVYFAPAYRY